MISLLKEFSKGSLQADLKTSDGSNAGSQDLSAKPVDVKFSLMRNMINTDGKVSGSNVNDYLERAQDMNDEIETVGFAIETDNGDIIKLYVAATEADSFEEEMAKLLGLEGDAEEAINQLAQKFDIVDVVWPSDPKGGEEDDLEADLSIDDASSVFAGTDQEDPRTPDDGDVFKGADLPAVDTGPDKTATGDGFEDIPPANSVETDDAPTGSEGFEDIPAANKEKGEKASADDEPTVDSISSDLVGNTPAEPEEEPVLDTDGNQKLDKDGNPVMRKKKAKKQDAEEVPMKTEEGLKRLGGLAEAPRDEIEKHVREITKLGNSGRYQIIASARGGITGPRTAPFKKNGEIAYFDTEKVAQAEADALTKRMNRAGATASFSYVPKLVEDKQPKEITMSLGSNFLSRLAEAANRDTDPVKDGMNIPLDTSQKQLVMNLKRPIEKKIVALFAMAGIVGRLMKAEPDVEERIRVAGEMLRKNQAARTAFTKFYNALATAKGYSPALEKTEVAEATKPEAKRGSALQQKFEAVMVALGLPESLVVSSGPSQLASYIGKTAKFINTNAELKQLLNVLAQRLGVHGDEAPEDREVTESVIGRQFLSRLDELTPLQSPDPFISDVLTLMRALGVPEDHLGYQTNKLRQGLMTVRNSMKSRGMVDQKIEMLTRIIASNVKPQTGNEPTSPLVPQGSSSSSAMPSMAVEGLLTEAFGELEALTDSDLQHYNVEEPAEGPAMMAAYAGGDNHAETVLAVGVDPEADGRLTLRVGIDGPWDGSIHAKYFTNDKDGYKAALAYANMLRTANLKTGGRPKGWK